MGIVKLAAGCWLLVVVAAAAAAAAANPA